MYWFMRGIGPGGRVGAQGPVNSMKPSVGLRIAAVIVFLAAALVLLAAALVIAAPGLRPQGLRTQGPRGAGPKADITKNQESGIQSLAYLKTSKHSEKNV